MAVGLIICTLVVVDQLAESRIGLSSVHAVFFLDPSVFGAADIEAWVTSLQAPDATVKPGAEAAKVVFAASTFEERDPLTHVQLF